MKNINCKTGLIPNIITKEVFEREIELCKKLNKENGEKCCWGTCDNCGVIPFLFKLHKGEIIDDEKEIKELKKDIFKQND